MPNNMNFDVRFTRRQIEVLLENPKAMYVTVSGSYNYRPDLGRNVWELKVVGNGCDINNNKIEGASQEPCIQPCP